MSEPVIEDLATKEELEELSKRSYKPNKPRKLLGWSYYCWECNADGYLLNPDQVGCPKCGTPFLLQKEKEDYQVEPVYQDDDYSNLINVIEPMMGEEVIVDEKPTNWEEIM